MGNASLESVWIHTRICATVEANQSTLRAVGTGKPGHNSITEGSVTMQDRVKIHSGLLGLITLACSGEPSEIVIQLEELDNSGQSGTATLRSKGDSTEVVIKITPASPDPYELLGFGQPVHIHFGGCRANLGNIEYSLNDLIAGESTTTVRMPLNKFTQGTSSINVHKSYEEFLFTTCGVIPKN